MESLGIYESEVKLEHISQPMKPEMSTNLWETDGSEKPLTQLNPRFYDVHDKLKTGNLQRKLTDLLTNRPEFNRFLANRSGLPNIKDKFRIALVDLTDKNKKLLNPEFAGWGSTVAEEAMSTIKVVVMYAAFQLLNDVRSFKAIHTVKDLIKTSKEAAKNVKLSDPPKFDKFLDTTATPPTIEFSSRVTEALSKIIRHPISESNKAAAYLIDTIGFSYVASLMLKSGLYHPQRGGLWVTSFYGKRWTKPFLPPKRSKRFFGRNATALSLATFFTLLGQRRLVTPDSSDKIRTLLETASWFTPVLPTAKIASKVGLGHGYMHEAGLIENGTLRYAVAIMTMDGIGSGIFRPLITELNNLIQQNNP
jgi:hypothetical protein